MSITIFKDYRAFLRTILAIGLPIILQNFISAAVHMIDMMMVGQLGVNALAAVGLCNQIYVLLNLIILGFASGFAVFMAQYWGSQNRSGLHQSIVFGLVLLLPVILIIALLIRLFPESIIQLFTTDSNVIQSGGQYLRIVVFSYIPAALCIFLGYALRSVNLIKYAVFTTIIALVINVALNYLLIFGIGPFPAMGVRGAALATVLARCIQIALLIILIYVKKTPVAIHHRPSLHMEPSLRQRYFKTTGHVLLNETLYGIGALLLVKVFAQMGTDVLAGTNAARAVENMVWIFFWSLCAAASVSIGHLIGAGKRDQAQRYAYQFIFTGLWVSMLLASILLITTPAVIRLFGDLSIASTTAAHQYLWIFAGVILIRGPIKILTGGVLRAGGDTRFVMLWDVIPLWTTFIVCYVLVQQGTAPTWLIFLFALGYELVKAIPTLMRVFRQRWIHNLVNDHKNSTSTT